MEKITTFFNIINPNENDIIAIVAIVTGRWETHERFSKSLLNNSVISIFDNKTNGKLELKNEEIEVFLDYLRVQGYPIDIDMEILDLQEKIFSNRIFEGYISVEEKIEIFFKAIGHSDEIIDDFILLLTRLNFMSRFGFIKYIDSNYFEFCCHKLTHKSTSISIDLQGELVYIQRDLHYYIVKLFGIDYSNSFYSKEFPVLSVNPILKVTSSEDNFRMFLGAIGQCSKQNNYQLWSSFGFQWVQIFYEFCNESPNGNWVEKAESKWFIISKSQYLIHRDTTLSIKLRNDDIIHFIEFLDQEYSYGIKRGIKYFGNDHYLDGCF